MLVDIVLKDSQSLSCWNNMGKFFRVFQKLLLEEFTRNQIDIKFFIVALDKPKCIKTDYLFTGSNCSFFKLWYTLITKSGIRSLFTHPYMSKNRQSFFNYLRAKETAIERWIQGHVIIGSIDIIFLVTGFPTK